ncbi:alpha/beta hydrolase-fold protein [Pedobacter sp.]|uniref:carboxylesterase family protein n=1 Tax=Pedobacter sp. TaxID=1411316 RepID=UPI003D7FDE42
MKHLQLIMLTILFTAIRVHAQDLNLYNKESYVKGKDSIQYRVLLPENFDANQKYPLLIFLHGSGERGSENEKQLTHGGKLFLDSAVRKNFPAIIVFPQCPEDDRWTASKRIPGKTGKNAFEFKKGGKPTATMHALTRMTNEFLKKSYVDRKQVYVGGLSMGAMGTYELLRRKPKTFAAAFAICGGDNLANVKKYRHVPLWIFHGGKDDVVSPELSKEIADHLKIIGKEVKFTLYADDNHNSWDSAFAEPQLLPWLFSHSK